MNSEHQLSVSREVVGGFTIGNYVITFCLNIGWVAHCVSFCWFYINKYKTCKRTRDLHPLYSDVQFLSRQRKLFNLETHIVKYVLAMLCLIVDMSGTVWMGVYLLLSDFQDVGKFIAKRNHIQESYSHCYIHINFARFYFSPIYIVLYHVQFVLFLVVFCLLCILTRYLTARYLNHSFKETLKKYIIWILIQLFISAICSTIYTFVFSFLLFPFLFIVNWAILLRDNLKLSRVLKSNLREIELHSNNNVLYREQYSSYSLYRFFQKCMLLSLLLFVIAITLFFLILFFTLIVDSFCLLDVIYGFNFDFNFRNLTLSIDFENYEKIGNYIIFAIYSLSTSLPLFTATLIPLFFPCIKRFRTRHAVYRFNYENFKQPLLNRDN